MKINLRETIKHAITKNKMHTPEYNGWGPESGDYVSEKTNGDLLSEEYFQTFEKILKL